jgi:hypothetical protein
MIGPYDKFAIEWGYRVFDPDNTPEKDLPHLNKIAERQLEDPMLRFGGGRELGAVGSADPRARSEDLGDDPILATTYGLKNIEYITGYLVEACGEKDKDYTQLNIMYGELLNQMFLELGQVAALVGGIETDNYVYGQSPEVFKPTERDKQKAAVQFLLKNGFQIPDYLLSEDIIMRIGMHGMAGQISDRQQRLLQTILNTGTANRIMDLDATGFANYTLVELLDDLQDGIFSELNTGDPGLDIYRRNLQRAYTEQLITFITPGTAAGNDLQAIARGKLSELERSLKKVTRKKGNHIEHYHFADLHGIITMALEGE